jgi:hypothetical protein
MLSPLGRVGFEMGSNLRFGKELCYNPFAPLLPSAPTLFNPYYYNVEGES